MVFSERSGPVEKMLGRGSTAATWGNWIGSIGGFGLPVTPCV